LQFSDRQLHVSDREHYVCSNFNSAPKLPRNGGFSATNCICRRQFLTRGKFSEMLKITAGLQLSFCSPLPRTPLCNYYPRRLAEVGGDCAFVVVTVNVFLSNQTKQRTRGHQVEHLQHRTTTDTRRYTVYTE